MRRRQESSVRLSRIGLRPIATTRVRVTMTTGREPSRRPVTRQRRSRRFAPIQWPTSCGLRRVDCRIDVAELTDRRVVRLAGRLADAQVPELLAACSKKGVHVDLNLGDLISVDAVGLDALD